MTKRDIQTLTDLQLADIANAAEFIPERQLALNELQARGEAEEHLLHGQPWHEWIQE